MSKNYIIELHGLVLDEAKYTNTQRKSFMTSFKVLLERGNLTHSIELTTDGRFLRLLVSDAEEFFNKEAIDESVEQSFLDKAVNFLNNKNVNTFKVWIIGNEHPNGGAGNPEGSKAGPSYAQVNKVEVTLEEFIEQIIIKEEVV